MTFFLVHNTAQSSYTFLRNNLSLQIYDTFITSGRGILTSCDTNGSTIWVYGYLHTSINKFLGIPTCRLQILSLIEKNEFYFGTLGLPDT